METNLPDNKVKVRIARCGKCDNIVFTSIEHLMDKQSHKEMAECVQAGCNVETITLKQYRQLNVKDWCDTKCKPKTRK